MKYFISTLLAVILFTTGCATIPSESVKLSTELGSGVMKQYVAEINLLNIYFELKRKELDDALQKAIKKYLVTITPKDSITLTSEQLADISKDILVLNEKNNIAKEGLEKVRIELTSKIHENYLILFQANATITSLLQSAISVKEATDKSVQLISTTTEGNIQIDKIFPEIDAYVLKGGYESGKIIEINDKIKSLIK